MKMKDDRRLINYYSSPLGTVTLESDGDVLTGLKFEERDGPPRPDESPELPVFAQTKRWLEAYFSGEIPDFTPPLRIDSTPFCKRVCEILLTIPYGETETYGAIAETIAKERGIPRMAAQVISGDQELAFFAYLVLNVAEDLTRARAVPELRFSR
ncbi:MAG: methylated-DNA--[Clostridia bacterium]|nr:methylated-DNA--[protein]-cysteine S-methyltransferase [Clostridia bacterium]